MDERYHEYIEDWPPGLDADPPGNAPMAELAAAHNIIDAKTQDLTNTLLEACQRLDAQEAATREIQSKHEEMQKHMTEHATLPHDFKTLRQQLDKQSKKASEMAQIQKEAKADSGQEIRKLAAEFAKSTSIPTALIDEVKQLRCNLAAATKRHTQLEDKLSAEVNKLARKVDKQSDKKSCRVGYRSRQIEGRVCPSGR